MFASTLLYCQRANEIKISSICTLTYFCFRYLDIRLAILSGASEPHVVHGLFGDPITDALKEIKDFLDSHNEEILILDFQHFYSFKQDDHIRLLVLLDSLFGRKLCPVSYNLYHITLRWMRENGYQVIVIYRNNAARGQPKFWPTEYFPTPWPNTTSVDSMIQFVESGMSSRPKTTGFVSQCILTPDNALVIRHPCGNLESKCGIPCNRAIIPWLEKQSPGEKGINIVIADFINMYNFPYSKTIIQLNAKLLHHFGYGDGKG